MIYVHRTSSFNLRQNETLDIKIECKKVAPAFVRRTDRFIQLGLLGVAGIAKFGDIDVNTALFMTSGQGNLAVFNRLCFQRYVEQVPPKPVDFINSLSNTAGFYIAKYLGLESKNLNLAQHGFVVENALLLVKASLDTGQETQILLGGVDEKPEQKSLPHSYLDVATNQAIGEGSNWMLMNNKEQDAVASIEVITSVLDGSKLIDYIIKQSDITHIALSQRINEDHAKQLILTMGKPMFNCLDMYDFYETNMLFVVNSYIEHKDGLLAYIDYFDGDYRVVLIQSIG
jgi:hypothetical protein